MKIGIITHWNVPNYGSFLQAYALQKFLSKHYDNAEVRLINYIKPVHIKMYYSYEVHENFRYWLINPRFYRDILHRLMQRNGIKRMRKFLRYYDELIPHTRKYKEQDIINEKFDYVVFGSDIVWDYSIPFFGHDKLSFGVGLDVNHKISYAASFGTVKRSNNHPSYVRDGLKAFEAISVRDINSGNIVKDITGMDAKMVIDPTLLWDFTNDENISQERKKSDYIIVYGEDFSKEQESVVIKVAKENNLRLINIGGTRVDVPWCDEYIWYDELNPFEWCAYMRDAYAVVACAFHGLMFSLAFNKKIMFTATQFMKDKASSFLDYLGLKEILIDNQDFDKQINWDWEYTEINKRIAALREDSISWINKCIR